MKRKIRNVLMRMVFFNTMFFASLLGGCRKSQGELVWESLPETEETGEAAAGKSAGSQQAKGMEGLGDERDTGSEETKHTDFKGTPDTETEQLFLYVDVCGAVVSPGVYRLKSGSRVFEAIEMAGGLTRSADRGSINQADLLSDGEKIRVYTIEEARQLSGERLEALSCQEAEKLSGEPREGNLAKAEEKVNLNTADEAGLCTLTGIGKARAQDIIAYRTEKGGFRTIEEIMNVSGIKEATFHKIKDKIVVE